MLSFNRKSFGVLLIAGTILMAVASFTTVNAEEKTKTSSPQNAVVVPQTANQTPAQEFFNKMSPEEFRNPVAMDDFISRFPDSPEARAVFAIRFSLLEKFPTIKGYNDFIQKYPDKLQRQIAIQEVFKLYRNQNCVAGYYEFIDRYPNTEQALVAMLYIQEIMFQYACQLDTEEEYDAFIEAFPDAPQVEAARDKAMNRAIEKEQVKREELVKNNANLDIQVRMMVNVWNAEINKFEGLYPTPESEIKQSERLTLYQIYRRAQVLQDVYKDIAATEPIQGSLQRFSISQRLKSIETLIVKKTDELIQKLDDVSKNITKEIGKIAKNQEDISKKLSEGFNQLHQDLKEIHTSIKETNKRLAKINDQFDAIANIFQTVTRFPTPNPFPMLPVYFEREINATNSFEPDEDVDGELIDFVEYRKQATRPMKDIALCGFETVSHNLFMSNRVGAFICDMREKWRSFTGNSATAIGKFLGKLVEKGVEFVPVIGPYIAPIAGKITEYCVDDLIIPYIKEIIDITKGNIELTLKIIEGYKLRLIQWVDIMASNHPELKAIKDIIIKFVIHGDSIEELVKSFKELVIQVARELQVKAEVLLYDILYLN